MISLLSFKKNKQLKAFAFLLIAGSVISFALLYKTYLLNTSYIKPSPLLALPTIFFYLGFSSIAFIFPWSWNLAKENKKQRILFTIICGIGFILLFQFIHSTIVWSTSEREYSLWKGFSFSLLYSGLLVTLIYSIISYALFYVGITKKEEQIKQTYLTKVSFKLKGKTMLVDTNDILFFEANDNYVSIYTNANKHYLVRKTISKLETQLDPSFFQRVHRKYLVNLNEIKAIKVDPKGGYFIYLPFDKVIKMSRTHKEKLHMILPSETL